MAHIFRLVIKILKHVFPVIIMGYGILLVSQSYLVGKERAFLSSSDKLTREDFESYDKKHAVSNKFTFLYAKKLMEEFHKTGQESSLCLALDVADRIKSNDSQSLTLWSEIHTTALLVDSCNRDGTIQESIATLKKALTLDPTNADLYFLLSEHYLYYQKKDKLYEALHLYYRFATKFKRTQILRVIHLLRTNDLELERTLPAHDISALIEWIRYIRNKSPDLYYNKAEALINNVRAFVTSKTTKINDGSQLESLLSLIPCQENANQVRRLILANLSALNNNEYNQFRSSLDCIALPIGVDFNDSLSERGTLSYWNSLKRVRIEKDTRVGFFSPNSAGKHIVEFALRSLRHGIDPDEITLYESENNIDWVSKKHVFKTREYIADDQTRHIFIPVNIAKNSYYKFVFPHILNEESLSFNLLQDIRIYK